MKNALTALTLTLGLLAGYSQTADTNDVALTVNVQTQWSTNQAGAMKACYRRATNDMQQGYIAALYQYGVRYTNWMSLTNQFTNAVAPVAPSPVALPTLADWVRAGVKPLAAQWQAGQDAQRVQACIGAFPAATVQKAWVNATPAQQTNWLKLWQESAYEAP